MPAPGPTTPAPAAARAGSRAAPRRTWRSRLTPLLRPEVGERRQLAGLVAVCLAVAVLSGEVSVAWLPPVAVIVPIVYGASVLRLASLRLLLGVAAGCLAVAVLRDGVDQTRPGAIGVVAIAGVLAYRLVASRERLGVPGIRGEAMLAELRDSLARQGELPPLPRGWHAEVVLRSAGGTSFGGDFVVSTTREHELELALVDVSGKGVDAATRSLLLAGALGGLLGGVPPADFLTHASDYLLRQDWEDGFATAVHLTMNLSTGAYTLDSAGHPPAAQFFAGSGRWELLDAAGLVLGVLPTPQYTASAGVLHRGDALLLYTDGLVERPGRDLSQGIDRLVGEANRLVVGGFDGGALRLVTTVAPHGGDDRAVVLLWRTL